MPEDALDHIRRICLALPESVETGGVGDPSFKVRDKIFAMQHQMNGERSVWCKAPAGVQGALVGERPHTFFVPPYVGHNGWVGFWLDRSLDWDEVADIIEESYRMTAPKRLSRLLEDR